MIDRYFGKKPEGAASGGVSNPFDLKFFQHPKFGLSQEEAEEVLRRFQERRTQLIQSKGKDYLRHRKVWHPENEW